MDGSGIIFIPVTYNFSALLFPIDVLPSASIRHAVDERCIAVLRIPPFLDDSGRTAAVICDFLVGLGSNTLGIVVLHNAIPSLTADIIVDGFIRSTIKDLLKQGRLDDEVPDIGLVLNRHESHAAGRARLLAHEDKTRHGDALAVADSVEIDTADHAAPLQLVPQEGDRMVPEREAFRAVILDHPTPLGHRHERCIRFGDLRAEYTSHCFVPGLCHSSSCLIQRSPQLAVLKV